MHSTNPHHLITIQKRARWAKKQRQDSDITTVLIMAMFVVLMIAAFLTR